MSEGSGSDLDPRVRLHIYNAFVDTGSPPSTRETAQALGLAADDVDAAYRRLAEGHAIVLAPGTLNVWMANPLSAVPTPFRVEVGGRSFWGNCIWDALGILAMLRTDGVVRTYCGDCQEPMLLEVRNGAMAAADGVIHFAVPAAHWWDNIGFN
jgi:Alkylmercury lyase